MLNSNTLITDYSKNDTPCSSCIIFSSINSFVRTKLLKPSSLLMNGELDKMCKIRVPQMAINNAKYRIKYIPINKVEMSTEISSNYLCAGKKFRRMRSG